MSAGPKSMTGFAQAAAEVNGCAVRIHVRSVNHRFLDLHLRLPEGFEVFEPRIREVLRGRLRRGHVDVVLRCDYTRAGGVHVNREVLGAYLAVAQDLRRQFGLAAEPDLAVMLRLPGVIAAPELAAEGAPHEELGRRIAACLEEALARLDQMRLAEGRALAEEMRGRIVRLGQHAARVEEMAGELRPAFARRLEARLRELLGAVPLDPSRLAQEAALLAERSDISEETVRLRSHLRQFGELLATAADAGKKLDFLLQEMQREANTILSKTPGVGQEGLAITEVALEMKAEIEKLREQVQNIE